MVRLLMEADGQTVWDLLTAHLKNGKSIRSLGDTIQIGAAELILRTTVPRQFTDGQHPFDYCNVANYWMRTSDNPYQARVLYLMAGFINDVARSNKLFTSVIEDECAGFDVAGPDAAALLARAGRGDHGVDVPRTTALAKAYLRSGADRRAYQDGGRADRLQVPGRPAQPEDHASRRSRSTAHNSTHLRDRLLLRRRAAAGRLAQDAGRARMLRPLHEGVDQQLARLTRPPGPALLARDRCRPDRS